MPKALFGDIDFNREVVDILVKNIVPELVGGGANARVKGRVPGAVGHLQRDVLELLHARISQLVEI